MSACRTIVASNTLLRSNTLIKVLSQQDGMCFVEKLHHTCGLFKIQDTPGQQTISLSRVYQGETIDVEVHMPDENDENDDEYDDEGSDENDGEDNDEDDTERGGIQLDVKVSKKGGLCLEFSCTAFPDEVEIDSLSIKDPNAEDQIAYEGPDFADLDENLQKAFHNDLETRGVKPSMTNFLHEYMINKDSREYLMW